MDARQLYQAVIVDHDRAPRNAAPLAAATHAATVDNPLCGDEVTVQLALTGDTITALRCQTRGCALARAAASIMSEQLHARTPADARALADRFARFVRADATTATDDTVTAITATDDDPPVAVAVSLGELTAFAGVRAFRSRQACATLPFRALLAALDQPRA